MTAGLKCLSGTGVIETIDIQHIHLLFEWIERPKIRKSLGKTFFYASNFQEQESYTPNYLTQSKFDFIENE